MKKQNFNIVVRETENILGGLLQTTEPMTDKQVMVLCQKIGREFIQNNDTCDKYPLDVCTSEGEMIMLVESIRFKRGNWQSTDYKVWDYRTESFVLDTEAERTKRKEAKYRENLAKAQKIQDAVEKLVKVDAPAEEEKPEDVPHAEEGVTPEPAVTEPAEEKPEEKKVKLTHKKKGARHSKKVLALLEQK